MTDVIWCGGTKVTFYSFCILSVFCCDMFRVLCAAAIVAGPPGESTFSHDGFLTVSKGQCYSLDAPPGNKINGPK